MDGGNWFTTWNWSSGSAENRGPEDKLVTGSPTGARASTDVLVNSNSWKFIWRSPPTYSSKSASVSVASVVAFGIIHADGVSLGWRTVRSLTSP